MILKMIHNIIIITCKIIYIFNLSSNSLGGLLGFGGGTSIFLKNNYYENTLDRLIPGELNVMVG